MSLLRVELGDVIELVMGQAPPGAKCNKEGIGTIFVKAGEFQDRSPAVREWTTQPLRMAREQDTLVCVVGATAGKVNLSTFDCAIGRSVAAVRPLRNHIQPGYLFRFLQTKVQQLRDRAQGAAQGVITREMIQGLTLRLPPLDEQERIAAIFDKADAVRTKRRDALAHLDRLAQSTFREMFGDPIANPLGWPSGMPLGDLSEVVSGVTKGRRLNGRGTREVPYLAVANVQDMKLNLGSVKTIEATDDEIARYRLKRGDLLLTEGGDPDKLGRGTLWAGELPECIHQNHIFRVRVTSSSLRPVFLNWLVASQRGKQYFLKSAKQTTGIASINMTQLRSFPLLLPPVELQIKFEAAVDKLVATRALLGTAAQELDHLFSSLQARAFRGGLRRSSEMSLCEGPAGMPLSCFPVRALAHE